MILKVSLHGLSYILKELRTMAKITISCVGALQLGFLSSTYLPFSLILIAAHDHGAKLGLGQRVLDIVIKYKINEYL